MLEHLCCCIVLITIEHKALTIPLSKLYDFRHSVRAILSVMPVSRKWEYLEIRRERGTDCLQSCNGRHFTWMEIEPSKLRRILPI